MDKEGYTYKNHQPRLPGHLDLATIEGGQRVAFGGRQRVLDILNVVLLVDVGDAVGAAGHRHAGGCRG